MRIKLLTASILYGFKNALASGSVVESDQEIETNEFKALINIGYAKETTEAVTAVADGHTDVLPELIDNGDGTFTDPELEALTVDGPVSDELAKKIEGVLSGTVGEVADELVALDDAELAIARKAEIAGKNRKGVIDAIDELLGEG